MKITSKELTDIFQKHVESLFPNKELKPDWNYSSN